MLAGDRTGLPLFRRGKVRDCYDLGDRLLVVASDRISAFDVILPTPIPAKGVVLTQLSRFWFEETRGLVPNHYLGVDLEQVSDIAPTDRARLSRRSMVVRKAERIDVECVMRGYLAGSAWAEYRALGTVGGERLLGGLRLGDRLPAPLFTPALKKDDGHDVNVTTADLKCALGTHLAGRVEDASRELYEAATVLAEKQGILIADSKFEFGLVDGELLLIDEALTPDSSRFWDAELYRPGTDIPSFDKQFVRDWLEGSGWDKTPPAPDLPQEVVEGTAARYREAYRRLTGQTLPEAST